MSACPSRQSVCYHDLSFSLGQGSNSDLSLSLLLMVSGWHHKYAVQQQFFSLMALALGGDPSESINLEVWPSGDSLMHFLVALCEDSLPSSAETCCSALRNTRSVPPSVQRPGPSALELGPRQDGFACCLSESFSLLGRAALYSQAAYLPSVSHRLGSPDLGCETPCAWSGPPACLLGVCPVFASCSDVK